MKSLVLLSGGLDSATCLALAVNRSGKGDVEAVVVDYGQRHGRELESARRLAEHYDVFLHRLDLRQVFKDSDCPLIKGAGGDIPRGSYAEQKTEGGVATYVPFRNGLFLSACASLALSVFGKVPCQVCIGAHADDAAGDAYADCSREFISLMDAAIRRGTYGLCGVHAPFAGMGKAEVVKQGLALKVPYELTWSCYEGGARPCGRCGTCIDRQRAFEANGAKDPLLTED